MEYQNILLTVREKIATLTVNRPQKLNALTSQVLSEIGAAAQQAPTYLVPGSEFACIQEAIDGAPAGSRLLVAPGEYHENIDFRGKGVTVESLEGPERTVLNGRPARLSMRSAG